MPADGRSVPPPAVPGHEAPAGDPAGPSVEQPQGAAEPSPEAPALPDASGPAERQRPPAPDTAARTWPQAPPASATAARTWPPAPPASASAGRLWSQSPPDIGAPGRPWPEGPAQQEPGGSPGAGDAGPKLRAAPPGDPFYLPRASWLWLTALIGLAVAAAPQALLTIAALIGGASPGDGGSVSAGSAVALAVGSLVLYSWEGFAAWLFSVRSAGRSFVLWGFRRPTTAYFWVIPLGLVAVYAFSIVHDIIVNPKQQAIVSDFPHSVLGAGMFVLVAVVMAPLFEEIVFRGFLFRGLANSWGWAWGALASAAIFGAAHLQLDVFLPLAALGFVLAWAYKKTGSLWTCITMHALFNLIAVVAWVITQLRALATRSGDPGAARRRAAQVSSVGLRSSRQWQSSPGGRAASASRRMRPMSPASSWKICASTSCSHSRTTPSP